MDRLYTTHDISHLLQVDPSTVSKWIDRGILLAFRTPGGHRRVRAADLRSFLISHEMPVPEELGGDVVRLMLLDGEKLLLELTRKAFKAVASSVDLHTTSSAVEALLQVVDLKPHGLVVDLGLTELDALELVRRLKAHKPLESVKLVTMTSRHTPEAVEASLKAGAVACLPKPLDPGALLELFRVPLAMRRSG
ncbi:MAG: response regulator [Myxococcaceae bacterium]|nr:response regulator [Myxococcaceae bacterium]MCI0671119.1 response regulator [Myxococcaceae bacterium]